MAYEAAMTILALCVRVLWIRNITKPQEVDLKMMLELRVWSPALLASGHHCHPCATFSPRPDENQVVEKALGEPFSLHRRPSAYPAQLLVVVTNLSTSPP